MDNGSLDHNDAAVAADSRIVPQCSEDAANLHRRLAARHRPCQRLAMRHSWRELLFLHWRIDPETIQRTLPDGLTVDTFEGRAWIGLVPFFMRNVRPWWSPSLPGLSNFQELNCRTYAVDEHGVPGVWFYSLDANSRLTVWGARRYYHLPYHLARMSFAWDRTCGRVDFRSWRCGIPSQCASRFVYEPIGPASPGAPGSLEFFLTERYVLFARGPDGRLYRGHVHHSPYQISPVTVEVFDETLLELNGFRRTGRPPDHAVVSRGVDVDIFRLTSNAP